MAAWVVPPVQRRHVTSCICCSCRQDQWHRVLLCIYQCWDAFPGLLSVRILLLSHSHKCNSSPLRLHLVWCGLFRFRCNELDSCWNYQQSSLIGRRVLKLFASCNSLPCLTSVRGWPADCFGASVCCVDRLFDWTGEIGWLKNLPCGSCEFVAACGSYKTCSAHVISRF